MKTPVRHCNKKQSEPELVFQSTMQVLIHFHRPLVNLANARSLEECDWLETGGAGRTIFFADDADSFCGIGVEGEKSLELRFKGFSGYRNQAERKRKKKKFSC